MSASIEAIRGYVLLTTPTHFYAFKVNSTGLHEVITEHWRNLAPVEPAEVLLDSPKLVNILCLMLMPSLSNIDEIILFTLKICETAQGTFHLLMQDAPCLATSRYNLVLLDLGKGKVGMFKSKLPFREPVSLQRDSWKRPLFAIAMAIVGCWQFARLK